MALMSWNTSVRLELAQVPTSPKLVTCAQTSQNYTTKKMTNWNCTIITVVFLLSLEGTQAWIHVCMHPSYMLYFSKNIFVVVPQTKLHLEQIWSYKQKTTKKIHIKKTIEIKNQLWLSCQVQRQESWQTPILNQSSLRIKQRFKVKI